MQMPISDRRGHDACNVVDCMVSASGSLLACMELTDRIEQRPFTEGYAVAWGELGDDKIGIVGTGAICLEWELGDGRRQVVGFMFRGDILTASECGAGMRVVALSDGVMYHLDAAVIDRCRTHRPDGRHWRAALIGARLAEATTHSLMLGRLTARERVAAFLMGLAARIGERAGGGVRIVLPMSREHIADHLGLKPETVSRQLSELRREGVIRLLRPCVVEIADTRVLGAMSPLSEDAAA